MTAHIVLRHADAVHVLSDGLVMGPGGGIHGRLAKVWPMPHLNAVLTLRGYPLLLTVFAAGLARDASCFDDLDALAPKNAKSLFDEFGPVVPSVASDFDLIIAGISEERGPYSFIVVNHDRYGLAPWTAVDLGACAMMPAEPGMLAEFTAAFPAGTSSQDVDPTTDGILIMEMIRRHPGKIGRSDMPMRIGGFVQHTSVSLDGIRTRIIHRWAD
jgi:hypothetical protein